MARSSLHEHKTPGLLSAAELACPRCGYDQRGGYDASARADPSLHPLIARCPECGVEFWWGDLLRPEIRVIDGFVEHAAGVGQWCRWAVRTWLWCWWPPRFWRGVKLEDPPRNWRALNWFVWPMLLLHAMGTVSLAWLFMMSQSNARSLPSPRTFAEWAVWSVFNPFGGLRITLGDPWYSAPTSTKWYSNLNGFPWWAFPLIIGVCVFVSMLLLVRATRRELRISAAHVVRAFLYWLSMLIALWLGWVVPTVMIATIGIVLGDAAQRQVWSVADKVDWLWPLVAMIAGPWSLWWFWSALTIGWRIERPARVAALLLVPASLAGVIVFLAQDFLLGVRPPWR
ncbi:MAG: hypothetical protein K2Y21_11740 [Phycisphaerales bacterium]|nr:hypothetical protein [Phycisphaerales bacterium]